MSNCCKKDCVNPRIWPWFICQAHITEIHNAWLERKPYTVPEPERKWDPPAKIKGSGPVDHQREAELKRERLVEKIRAAIAGGR